MLPPRFIIGFSGHRDLTPDQMVACGEALDRIFNQLSAEAAKEGGICELYSSLSCGADQVAVQTADRRGMPVHLILPKPVRDENGRWLEEGGFREDFTGNELLSQQAVWEQTAVRIRMAEQAWQDGSCRVVMHTGNAPECYYDMALQIMDAADAVVVVWDKERPNTALGGTQDYVNLARQQKVPLKYWNPANGLTRSERLELFPPLEGLDHLRKLSDIAAGAGVTRPPEALAGEDLINWLDEAACRTGSAFRGYLVRKIFLHASAVATGAVAALAAGSGVSHGVLITLAAAESVILLRILHHNRRVKRTQLHSQWICTRFAAELLRAQLAARDLLDPLHLPVTSHPHPEWRRFALSASLLAHAANTVFIPWQEARRSYVEDRLENASWQKGQIEHFRHQHEAAAGKSARLAAWGRLFTAAAAFFVLGGLFYRIWKAWAPVSSPPSPWPFLLALSFGFFPIILPLAAGVCISLRSSLDTGRRALQYAYLARRMEAAANILIALRTEASVRRAVLETEEILLNELFEWKLAEERNAER